MKIGIVCYPTYGGSGVVATELGMELANRGHEVHFVSYQPPARFSCAVENLYFHEVEMTSYPVFKHPPYLLAVASKLAEVARIHDLDKSVEPFVRPAGPLHASAVAVHVDERRRRPVPPERVGQLAHPVSDTHLLQRELSHAATRLPRQERQHGRVGGLRERAGRRDDAAGEPDVDPDGAGPGILDSCATAVPVGYRERLMECGQPPGVWHDETQGHPLRSLRDADHPVRSALEAGAIGRRAARH